MKNGNLMNMINVNIVTYMSDDFKSFIRVILYVNALASVFAGMLAAKQHTLMIVLENMAAMFIGLSIIEVIVILMYAGLLKILK